jgi:CheY-like chemotaxis protein
MPFALVVDDNRIMCDSLVQMISFLGVEAYPAYGPRAGILSLIKTTPDVVFLDINMPGVSGLEVLAYLRREPRLEKVPVVVVTSDDQPQTATSAYQRGVIKVIIKPATLEALENVLKEIQLI